MSVRIKEISIYDPVEILEHVFKDNSRIAH